ncbi:acyl-CoA dehydrogenase family protein [Frondihabitans australicus]|uniref:Acyl-CoA dehydrogenase n=1 Tax=Frondihabitans australicus TaxID=386892 RepID=A0A495IK98_9MICO|nr:acyl-CoA dehydrogenase family protein [Frondihabitans australicus]RKR76394.1 acyl-CoA dehydrogenase [Frondihabitans australicus]
MSDLLAGSITREGSLVERAQRVADIAARFADDVDSRARFPQEAIAAFRDTGLLAAAVPSELGGEDASVTELGEIATIVGEACSASAMIFAMHQIQVLCLTRHGLENDAVRDVLLTLAREGALFASATTEAGIGGSIRTSSCFVDRQPNGRVSLAKTAPVISYGAHADVVLATARRNADAPASDQVFVVCPVTSTTLTQIGEWDTLGMRGTASPGFELHADVPADHVLDVDYATISAETMLPVSHSLWAAVWLGIAHAAADRATTATQRAARKSIGTLPPSATRLAELLGAVTAFEAVVADAFRTFEDLRDQPRTLTSVPYAIAFNSLKITASESLIDIVSRAMLVTGIAGYRQDSDVSLGRLLRDSYGTAVMINNDRILANNAQLSLLQRKKSRR